MFSEKSAGRGAHRPPRWHFELPGPGKKHLLFGLLCSYPRSLRLRHCPSIRVWESRNALCSVVFTRTAYSRACWSQRGVFLPTPLGAGCSPTAGSWLLELRASLPAQGSDTARSPRGMLRSSAQAMHPGMPQEEPCTSVSSNNSSRLSNPLVFLEILQAIKTA